MPAAMPRVVRQWSLRLLRLAVLVYLGLCLAAYLGQDWLMYPAQRGRGVPPTAFHLGPPVERVDLTTPDGTPIAAAYAVAATDGGSPRPDAATRPTVVFFYGNGMTATDSWPQIDAFRRLGANVVVADYPGYGASGGRMTEPAAYAAADAAYDLARRRSSGPVIAAGWSLGAAMAVDLASRRPTDGLIVFNAFTSMPEMAGRLLPWLPVGWICRGQYANEAKIGRVRCPTLICNGLRDTMIPAAMSDRLAAAAGTAAVGGGGVVMRLRVATADHDSIFDADPAAVRAAVRRAIDDVAR